MSYKIEKLDVQIPIEEARNLKSDVIVGYNKIRLSFIEDDTEVREIYPYDAEGAVHFFTENLYGNNDEDIEELADIVEKYKGTLLAKVSGEDEDTEYIRIRKGERKKIKIVEV